MVKLLLWMEVDSLITTQINIMQYQAKRTNYVKNPSSIDVDSGLILHFAAKKTPKFDTHFVIAVIKKI